ncbi:MAG: phosphorylase [Chloroflexota bacterium]|nr:phosphorylase [Chloroflexota bacterium]
MTDDTTQGAGRTLLAPGALWELTCATTAKALAGGALQPIKATRTTVVDAGIPFEVHVADLPPEAPPQPLKPAYVEDGFDPFLPYDPALYVADLSPTHVCLLNKFNVLDYHLLMVTRAFEHQETWLTLADMEAMCLCLAEFEGLAFFNGGRIAGASQRHKHLQYVPLPLLPGGTGLPIAPALDVVRWEGDFGATPLFSLAHALVRLDPAWLADPRDAAARTLDRYWALLDFVGIERGDDERQTRAYNLLATREWMLVIPRSQDAYEGIAVHGLGYAGSFMVWDEARLQLLRQTGPLAVLRAVGEPPPDLRPQAAG